MSIGILRIKFQIPGCASLKEKRSHVRPLLSRIRKEFNVSAAELDFHDIWQTAEIGLATISTDPRHTQSSLQSMVNWIEQYFPDLVIEEEKLEIF